MPHIDHRSPAPRAALGAAAAAALLLLGAPSAGAVTVPYAVDFQSPAIVVGGLNEAYLDCPTDVGAAVAVKVTDPAAVTHDLVTHATDATSNVPGRVFVEVGPAGLFTADAPGTWSAAITCPGYDPYVTTFQALAPTLPMTVAIDTDDDCATTEPSYLVGSSGRTCVTITNTTNQDIRRMGLQHQGGTGFQYPAAGEFPAGATRTFAVSGPGPLPFGGTTMTGLFVWAELGASGSGTFAVTAEHTIDVPPLPAPLALTATTGLTAATACAGTGGLATRVVPAGTSVHLCYRVTNTSGIAYHQHGLVDDGLGSLLTSFPLDLEPGDSYAFVAPAPIVVTASEAHTGTWRSIEASDYDTYTDFVAGAAATATITVAAAETTTTTTPTSTSTSTIPSTTTTTAITTPATEAIAATPVRVTPAFTG